MDCQKAGVGFVILHTHLHLKKMLCKAVVSSLTLCGIAKIRYIYILSTEVFLRIGHNMLENIIISHFFLDPAKGMLKNWMEHKLSNSHILLCTLCAFFFLTFVTVYQLGEQQSCCKRHNPTFQCVSLKKKICILESQIQHGCYWLMAFPECWADSGSFQLMALAFLQISEPSAESTVSGRQMGKTRQHYV